MDGIATTRAIRRAVGNDVPIIIISAYDWSDIEQEARAAAHPEPTDAERAAYIRQAKACLPQRVAYYSERMGLYPTQVRITGARTRFGSCSSQGHICFSWRLMQYPPEAIDYVVVHELAHLRYMNHGAEFYALIARYLPDWKARRALLRA